MQVQGVTLPQVQNMSRMVSVMLGLQSTPSRGVQYTRQLAANGDAWEIQGFVDHVTLDQFLALPDHGALWVTDPDRGNFHATLEVEATWTAIECSQAED
jgi:hypothetical protein